MKIVVKIFNVIYLVFAAVAITCFCTQPYISIHGGYNLKGEQIAQVLPPEIEQYLTKEEVKTIIDAREVKVNLNLEVPAKLVFSFNDKAATEETIQGMIDKTVNDTVTELQPTIHDLAEAIAKKTASKLIFSAIEDYVDMFKKPELTDTGAVLVEAGIDEGYITNFTDEVYTKLTDDGATMQNIENVVSAHAEDVVDKLVNSGAIEPEDAEAMKQQMDEELSKNLEESFKEYGICDEDGNITDIDAAINTLLISLLDSMIKEGDEEGGEPETKAFVLRASEQDVEDTQTELTKRIRTLINQYVDQFGLPQYVSNYGLYILIVTLFLMLPWALLGIVAFIRILRPKKCWIKPWFVFVFASIQLLLGVVLTLATSFFLPNIINLLPLGGEFVDVLNSLSIVIKTSSFIPSIFYLIMIPMGIVYAVFRHKVKKQYKADKAARKAEKKAEKAA